MVCFVALQSVFENAHLHPSIHLTPSIVYQHMPIFLPANVCAQAHNHDAECYSGYEEGAVQGLRSQHDGPHTARVPHRVVDNPTLSQTAPGSCPEGICPHP